MSSAAEKPTILIVDDTPENLMVLDEILRADYKVKAANNGERALKIALSDHPPDLILLDIMMPGLSGYQVCEKLKSESATRKIPIIFVTAMSEVEDEAKGFSLGAVDYITKPVSPPVVKARVKAHLAFYNQTRELERMVRERTAELDRTLSAVVERLGRVGEFRDNQTGMHVIRVAHYCRAIGQAAGMNDEDVELLFNAAPLHDIGKVGVGDSILLKPDQLDDTEFAIMRSHSPIGGEIIGRHESGLMEMARLIALTHHEKWNGTGYPNKLKGEEIPLVGRITAIADVFDALISERPYKKGWPFEEAVALIQREAGESFDPNLVEKFISVLPQITETLATYADKPQFE